MDTKPLEKPDTRTTPIRVVDGLAIHVHVVTPTQEERDQCVRWWRTILAARSPVTNNQEH